MRERERRCVRKRRIQRWINASSYEDTRCALRELTRESRVLATKHGTQSNEIGQREKKEDHGVRENVQKRKGTIVRARNLL